MLAVRDVFQAKELIVMARAAVDAGNAVAAGTNLPLGCLLLEMDGFYGTNS
jgi:hypothetical protein